MKQTNKGANGTSFHDDTIFATVADLRKVLGEPQHEQNDGSDKSNYDFTLETSTGDVFTIYDWKTYRPIGDNEMVSFHIGGHNSTVTEQAKNELIKML
jgi:hypothetical protein